MENQSRAGFSEMKWDLLNWVEVNNKNEQLKEWGMN